MPGRFALLGLLVLVVGVAPAAGGLANPTPVVATKTMETQPAGSVDWLAWTQGPLTKPNLRALWVRPLGGGPRFRVNPGGTTAYLNAGSIDGDILVHSQRKTTQQNADVKLFNMTTRTPYSPPAGVNTSKHECCASISGDWLMFTRWLPSHDTRRIFLFNLSTHVQRKLVETRDGVYSQIGSVRGNWAVWTRCVRPSHCKTYLHDIAANTTTELPNPNGKSQYAASVTADGTVYYAESSNIDCGKGFGIWRAPLTGPRVRLISLKKGLDTIVASPVVNADTSVTVYFDRIVCRTGQSDIFKFTYHP